MTPRTMSARAALLAVLGLVLASCGDAGTGETAATTDGATTTTTEAATTTEATTDTTEAATTTEATTTTTVAAEEEVVIHLFEESEPGFPVLVPVAIRLQTTEGIEGAALQALIEGPSEAHTDQIPPLTTAIPEGTRLLGVSIEGGIATIDLSAEFESGGGTMAMFSRLGQVVYTATGFPSIEGVRIALDGTVVDVFSGEGLDLSEPVTRTFLEGTGLVPEVLLESPAWWATADSPVSIVGTTSPGTAIAWELLDDDGLPMVTGEVTSAEDGSFSVEVPYDVDRAQVGTVIVTAEGTMVERAFHLTLD